MEEENSALVAPVTRLRRRLSVESVEEKSSTPNTPTKKRGRPPKLNKIDENDVTPKNATPKRTTRRTAKDTLETVEDKPLTPVRRSTRITSNTSLDIAVPASDTPRAKRVTRRNSQLGSDSEAPLTPAKQTRKTRKDSTPKLDKDETEKALPHITEIIAEEPELIEKDISTPSHSPNNKKEISMVNKKAESKLDNSVNEYSNKNNALVTTSSSPDVQKENISPKPRHSKKGNLSASTIDLLNNVESRSKTDYLNKTTSFTESNVVPYKKRTRSWSAISLKRDDNSIEPKDMKIPQINCASAVDSSPDTIKNKDFKTVKVIVDKIDVGDIHKQNSPENKYIDMSSEELFNQDPNEMSKPEIIIVDSISEKDIQNCQNTQDQYVPVVDVPVPNVDVSLHDKKETTLNISLSDKRFNDSVEPMEIDQTIPDGMVLPESDSFSTDLNNKAYKSILISETKRKSSMSMKIENNSTLLVSEPIEDASQTNMLGKSPMPVANTSISKSLVDLDKTQNIDKEQKNQSITCLTSTPLQQRPLQKLIAPINTSIIKSNDNFPDTPKNSVDTNSLLVNLSTEKADLSPAIKSLGVDKECDESVTNKVENANDSKIKCTDDAKNVSINDKSNVFSPKIKGSENNMSAQSNKSKESRFLVNVDSSSNDSDGDMSHLKRTLNESKNKSKAVLDHSDDSDTSNEPMQSDLVIDEADDAGDDYESGDSQDEEEVQYAKENEIIDKGVTLTSDEDFSNDSDYEKDSFIVSSNEEDDQLLEGTEDDLSMSDNELKMTAKSKKKYDERMIKEQKKASKEMYESRHKLKNKKKNVIEDDSESESDDENAIKVQKKSNRMRFDSSNEISQLNESKSRTENKKRMSESDKNGTLNEKEMTQMNISSQESDPLATSIKKESKSPKNKGTKLDTAQSGIKVSIAASQLNLERAMEPSEKEDSSSDSDTNNIVSNYDSILSSLKSVDKKLDTSLNIDVKKKLKDKRASIIDELNLTQSGQLVKPVVVSTAKENPNQIDLDDDSSDSISLKLLISEDSKDSVYTKNEDEAIPLRSDAKMDLTTNEEENMDCASEDIFFIDTKGSPGEDAPAEEVIHREEITNRTPKSDKKKKNTKMLTDANDTLIEENIAKGGNTSSTRTPKSDKKKKITETLADANDTLIEENIAKGGNTSSTRTPKSDKKKKITETLADANDALIEHMSKDGNTSSARTPKSDKKKRVSQSLVNTNEAEENTIQDLNTSSVKAMSDKKKKRSKQNNESMQEAEEQLSFVKTPKSDKKKQRLSESQMVEPKDEIKEEHNTSRAKTPIDQDSSESNIQVSELNSTKPNTPKSDKKKKLDLSESQGNIQGLDSSVAKTPKSAKKKKLSLSELQTNAQELNMSNAKTPKSEKKKKHDLSMQANKELDSKANTPKSERKNKDTSQKNSEDVTREILVDEVDSNEKTPKSEKKKRRRSGQGNTEVVNVEEVPVVKNPDSSEKLSNPQTHTTIEGKIPSEDNAKEAVVAKKKRKRTFTVPAEEIKDTTTPQSNGNKNKKRKIKDTVVEAVKVADVKKGRKRKEREDDEHDLPKAPSKMTVPRLPMSVITQLSDNPKPRDKKKPKVISTSEFIVEDYRRKMPSKYLEESVYLNNDSPEKKRPKKNLPKVLPSMPSSSSSNHGFTTTFKINVLSAETKFVAKAENVANFREDRLNKNQKRREHLKKLGSSLLSKF